MGKRHRERQPARKASSQPPKPLILIVTEGEVTEPEYLHGYKRACHNPRVRIETAEGAGVPATVVKVAKELKRKAEHQAKRERDENLKFDEVWCVFDIDEHPDIPGAREMARANGLQLAVSNPCIELWLWLHFADSPGMRQRHELQHMLKQHLPQYNKHVNYSDFVDRHLDAERRAEALDALAHSIGSPGMNPTTGIYLLTRSIRST